MSNEQVPERMQGLLKRSREQAAIRITTYLEPELYQEVIRLKQAGISIKKVVNEAVSDLLKKYNLI
jgi:hypothetical protein